MNIIEHLQKDSNYINFASKALQTEAFTIDIDCSKSETDNTLILYIKKDGYTFNEAMCLLTMKQKMLQEEWEDLDLYNADDIKLWAKMLAKIYSNSTYFENISDTEFLNDHFMNRLQVADNITAIFYNNEHITHKKFLEITPCKSQYLKICKSTYKHLEAEYYLETEQYFVLFNWFTTA
jgi:hypothetical protein